METSSLNSSLMSLVVGDSVSVDSLKSSLGSPLETISDGSKVILTFESGVASRPHIVHIDNGKLSFVQVSLKDTDLYTDKYIVTKYGEPADKSYSAHLQDSIVYSYPSLGLTFHIDEGDGKAYLIQKTAPTSLEVYKETVGKDFTSEKQGDTFEGVNEAVEEIPGPSLKSILTNYLPGSNLYTLVLSTLLALFLAILILRKIRNGRGY